MQFGMENKGKWGLRSKEAKKQRNKEAKKQRRKKEQQLRKVERAVFSSQFRVLRLRKKPGKQLVLAVLT